MIHFRGTPPSAAAILDQFELLVPSDELLHVCYGDHCCAGSHFWVLANWSRMSGIPQLRFLRLSLQRPPLCAADPDPRPVKGAARITEGRARFQGWKLDHGGICRPVVGWMKCVDWRESSEIRLPARWCRGKFRVDVTPDTKTRLKTNRLIFAMKPFFYSCLPRNGPYVYKFSLNSLIRKYFTWNGVNLP